MTITGVGSSAIGDKIGDALAQLVAWGIAKYCKCAPPDAVISAIHTLSVSLVVAQLFAVIHCRAG